MARNYGKGQQYDKYYRYFNNYLEKQEYKDRINNLDLLQDKLIEIKSTITKSDYEIKDKNNLIEIYTNYINLPY